MANATGAAVRDEFLSEPEHNGHEKNGMTLRSKVLFALVVSFVLVAIIVTIIIVTEKTEEERRSPREGTFNLISLGTAGGLLEGQLTGYMLSAKWEENETASFLVLDPGTLIPGLHEAIEEEVFYKTEPAREWRNETELANLLRRLIGGYAISHSHLDHTLGLYIASPADSNGKPILASQETLSAMQESVFNWRTWPNFGSNGTAPSLNKYQSVPLACQNAADLSAGEVGPFKIGAQYLSHGTGANGEEFLSTAFLIETESEKNGPRQLLYLGDTGPDSVEGKGRLAALWKNVAPLVAAKSLRAIMIECSYDDSVPDSQLQGHMAPRHVLAELTRLSEAVSPSSVNTNLLGLRVLITHVKPSDMFTVADKGYAKRIIKQLNAGNKLGVKFSLPPKQGHLLLID